MCNFIRVSINETISVFSFHSVIWVENITNPSITGTTKEQTGTGTQRDKLNSRQ